MPQLCAQNGVTCGTIQALTGSGYLRVTVRAWGCVNGEAPADDVWRWPGFFITHRRQPQVNNIGTLAADYYASVTSCSAGVQNVLVRAAGVGGILCDRMGTLELVLTVFVLPQHQPLQAQFATIAAGGSYTFLFTITMTTDQAVPSSTCAIQIADFEGEILAVSSVTWHTNGTNYESPTNDGTGSPPVRRRWRGSCWALGVVHGVSNSEQCLTHRITAVTISHTPFFLFSAVL